MDYSDSIDRARMAMQVKTDYDLANALNVAQSSVSGWRKRKTLPLEQAVKIAEMTGCSLDWLILGKGQPAAGQTFYTAPALDENLPRIERLQKMADWHIEQLHQITLERMREEAKNQD